MQGMLKKLKDQFNHYIFPITHSDAVFVESNKTLTQKLLEIGTGTAPTSKWAGKNANFLGDSITLGTNTTKIYHQYLKEDLGLLNARNYGNSGSTIADGNDPMYSRATIMDVNADLVCVFGGTNDFNSNVPLGNLFTLDGSGNRVISTDTTTFYGALHQLCKTLINTYTSKQIVLFTPIHREVFSPQPTEFQKNTVNLFLEDYVDAIIEIGKWYSIPVLDLYRVSGLQPNEASNKALYFTSTDGLHPNATGHQVIAKKIEAFLNTV